MTYFHWQRILRSTTRFDSHLEK